MPDSTCYSTDRSIAAPIVRTTFARRVVRKCKPYMAVVSPVIAVLSFIGGALYNGYQARMDARESAIKEWREALEKVRFDDDTVVQSAFLLNTFEEEDSPYKAEARRMEVSLLHRVREPETFELAFQNLVDHTSSHDEMANVIEVGAHLNKELRKLYKTAQEKEDSDGPHRSFAEFLSDPTASFQGPESRDALNRTLALLWELDSYSNDLGCGTDVSGDCPPLPVKSGDLRGLVLVNYKPRTGRKGGTQESEYVYVETCAIQLDESLSGYQCVRR